MSFSAPCFDRTIAFFFFLCFDTFILKVGNYRKRIFGNKHSFRLHFNVHPSRRWHELLPYCSNLPRKCYHIHLMISYFSRVMSMKILKNSTFSTLKISLLKNIAINCFRTQLLVWPIERNYNHKWFFNEAFFVVHPSVCGMIWCKNFVLSSPLCHSQLLDL